MKHTGFSHVYEISACQSELLVQGLTLRFKQSWISGLPKPTQFCYYFYTRWFVGSIVRRNPSPYRQPAGMLECAMWRIELKLKHTYTLSCKKLSVAEGQAGKLVPPTPNKQVHMVSTQMKTESRRSPVPAATRRQGQVQVCAHSHKSLKIHAKSR